MNDAEASPTPRDEPQPVRSPVVYASHPSDQLSLVALVRLLLGGLLLVVVLRHAWVNDDAYITFRTIDNFVHGDGLGWNADERVQAYTHPLWMLLFSAVYFITRETYLTAIFFSLVVSAAAVWLAAWRHARSATHGALVLVAMLSSLSFTDYSTSGLENPLSHLLLGIFFLLYLGGLDGERRPRDLLRLALVACALTLNRMDLILVVLPALAEAVWETRRWRSLLQVLAGFAPLLVWELFSLVYYGFLFPNTAYAKLGTGIPLGELLGQGFLYFVSTLDQDPLTLWVLAVGLLIPALTRRRRDLAAAAGALLYVLYLVPIGGDFMLGRFLSPPLYVALLLLARAPMLPASAAGLVPAGLVLAVGALLQLPTLSADGAYPKRRLGREPIDARGVADERAYYFDANALLAMTRNPPMPERAPRAQEGIKARAWPQKTHVFWATGMGGFFAGRQKHAIDHYALTDPLLARLPGVYESDWRTGHCKRVIPDGYFETLETGQNRLVDEGLRRYYDDLRLVVRGPIFSGARFAAMWRLNTGADDALIDVARYRDPRTRDVGFARLRLTDGAPPAPEPVGQTPRSVQVRFDAPVKTPVVGVRVEADDSYRVAFARGDQELGSVVLPAVAGETGYHEHRVVAPQLASKEGYDSIEVVGLAGKGNMSLGGIRLGEPPR